MGHWALGRQCVGRVPQLVATAVIGENFGFWIADFGWDFNLKFLVLLVLLVFLVLLVLFQAFGFIFSFLGWGLPCPFSLLK
jgi:hypothetical protein